MFLAEDREGVAKRQGLRPGMLGERRGNRSSNILGRAHLKSFDVRQGSLHAATFWQVVRLTAVLL